MQTPGKVRVIREPLTSLTPDQRVIWGLTISLLDKYRSRMSTSDLFSGVLSRVSREMRRELGLDRAKAAFRRVAYGLPHRSATNVSVPPADYQMDPEMRLIWAVTGLTIDEACQMVGAGMAFSIILTVVSLELQKVAGADQAKGILLDMANTMDEAAKFDIIR